MTNYAQWQQSRIRYKQSKGKAMKMGKPKSRSEAFKLQIVKNEKVFHHRKFRDSMKKL